MASPNVTSTPSTLIGRDETLLTELEQGLEAATIAAGCKAAYEWALIKMEQGLPSDLILQVIAVNAIGRRAVD